MKRKFVITLFAFGFSAMAVAQEGSPIPFSPSSAEPSRAAVRAEVAQDRASGSLQRGGEATMNTERVDRANARTRDAVRTEGRAKSRSRILDEYNIGS